MQCNLYPFLSLSSAYTYTYTIFFIIFFTGYGQMDSYARRKRRDRKRFPRDNHPYPYPYPYPQPQPDFNNWPRHMNNSVAHGTLLIDKHFQREAHPSHDEDYEMGMSPGHETPLHPPLINTEAKESNSTTDGPTIIVRGEEIGIVVVVLLLWVGAIILFFNRWGKIRMLEPYQPKFCENHRPSCPMADVTGMPHCPVSWELSNTSKCLF